jgi:uncharacterized Zn finger protein
MKAKIKCRNCGSQEIALIEYWKGQKIIWFHGDSLNDGVKYDDNAPYKVTRRCQSCGHEWRIKGAQQISDDMFTEPEVEE